MFLHNNDNNNNNNNKKNNNKQSSLACEPCKEKRDIARGRNFLEKKVEKGWFLMLLFSLFIV
jgi:hypothetical protein